MTTPFRNETETLRSQLAMVTAERDRLAAELRPPLSAKVPMRWGVPEWGDATGSAFEIAAWGALAAGACVIVWMLTFVIWGHIPFSWPSERRGAMVAAILVALWCLAFVRRVKR